MLPVWAAWGVWSNTVKEFNISEINEMIEAVEEQRKKLRRLLMGHIQEKTARQYQLRVEKLESAMIKLLAAKRALGWTA